MSQKFIVCKIPTGKQLYSISDADVKKELKAGNIKNIGGQIYAPTEDGIDKVQTYMTRDMAARAKTREVTASPDDEDVDAPEKAPVKKKASTRSKA